MKKIFLLSAFWILTSTMFSQNVAHISGLVTDLNTEVPLPYYPVTIQSVPSNGFSYYNVVYTNENGYYQDTVSLINAPDTGTLKVSVVDCQQYRHILYCSYAQGNILLTANFSICPANPLCVAAYSYLSTDIRTMKFIDESTGGNNLRMWDFGDGSISTLPNPIHTFPAKGNYVVKLDIGAQDSTCWDSESKMVYVADSNAIECQASFTFATVPGTPPNVLQFFDMSYSSVPVNWFWNFDDGTISTEQNPLHVFPSGSAVDPYNVCLTISSYDSMCSSTDCLPIQLQTQDCQAQFTVLPAPNAIRTFNFVDQSVGGIWQWIWDFGDGITDTITLPINPNVSHTYQFPGFYTACLTVLGDYGLCNSMHCETVAVYDSLPGCQAQYSYYPDSASSIPNVIKFVDLSLGSPTQWFWEFGDPASGALNTSTTQNPLHSFTTIGTYNVCLTIGGPNCQSVWCGTVEIGSNTNCVNYFTFSQIGLSVNFQGQILNSAGGVFLWNFGDEQTGTGQNILHNYTWPGTYIVTLTTTTASANPCTYNTSKIISIGDTILWSQLYGQVFANNFPVTQGQVFLFSLDTNGVYVPYVDASGIDSTGVYYFDMVPQGSYVIYAIPFTNGYIPTYYGNTLNWQNASVIQIGTPNNPYNMNLIQSDGFNSGIGKIGGQITQGDFSGSMIDKITMLLKDANGKTILYSQVDASGHFDFPQLAYGIYYLYAELAGCETQTIQVVLSEANPNVEIMLTLSGNSLLGKSDTQVSFEAGSVFPNPVKQDAHIVVKLNDASNLTVELYNMSGQLVYAKTNLLNAGETDILIPLGNLTDGVYLLKIYNSEGLMLIRKLVKFK